LRSGLKLWLIGKPVLIVLEGNRQRKASRSESNQTNEQHWLSHGQTEEPATVTMAGGTSTIGEIHRHFKADAQVGKGGFIPHGQSSSCAGGVR
jgi:hypothetical protein